MPAGGGQGALVEVAQLARRRNPGLEVQILYEDDHGSNQVCREFGLG